MIRAFPIPLDGFGNVSFDAFAVFITKPEGELRHGIIHFRGFLIPFERFLGVLGNAFAFLAAYAKPVLGFEIALVRGFPVPLDRLGHVILFFIMQGEVVLRFPGSLFGVLANRFQAFRVPFFRNTPGILPGTSVRGNEYYGKGGEKQ